MTNIFASREAERGADEERRMQRTVEIADFELPRGSITIQALMAMEPPEDRRAA